MIIGMSGRVLVVQHAEKNSSVGDPGLTARGRRQAQAVAGRLSGIGPIDVYTSAAARAVLTAQAIAAGCECPLDTMIDDRLRERMNWGGEDSEQSLADFLLEWNRSTHDRTYVPMTGDSSASAAI